jgi:hypothetical protein
MKDCLNIPRVKICPKTFPPKGSFEVLNGGPQGEFIPKWSHMFFLLVLE